MIYFLEVPFAVLLEILNRCWDIESGTQQRGRGWRYLFGIVNICTSSALGMR